MNVKRRGIYVADLGEKIDSSVEGGIRPVLVLQNDKGNEHSTTVIIAPITSKLTKHRIPMPSSFLFLRVFRTATNFNCTSVQFVEICCTSLYHIQKDS